MTNIDAMITFDKFFKNYPSGEITQEQFLEEYKDNVMAEAFFKMFDEGVYKMDSWWNVENN